MTKMARHVWEGIYPVILYTVLISIIGTLLRQFTPIEEYSPMLLNAASMVICILPMYSFYAKVATKRGKLNHLLTDLLIIVGVCALLAIGLNYLIDLLNIKEISVGFGQVTSDFNKGPRIWRLIAVGVIAPILEEVVYRGIVFGNFKIVLNKWVAIGLSAAIFGLFHYNLPQFLYAGILGVAFAYIYDKTGQLYTCIIGHAAANVVVLLFDWYHLHRYFAATVTTQAISGCIACIVAVILLVKWKKV
ncbi:MAG: CPBP family intramembrane metalloprotease [Lachnospiraceae bacterium]|nr:CPBP family intramembrane metalloprotease [Lachnospiraceae bacterium]